MHCTSSRRGAADEWAARLQHHWDVSLTELRGWASLQHAATTHTHSFTTRREEQHDGMKFISCRAEVGKEEVRPSGDSAAASAPLLRLL